MVVTNPPWTPAVGSGVTSRVHARTSLPWGLGVRQVPLTGSVRGSPRGPVTRTVPVASKVPVGPAGAHSRSTPAR